MGRYSAAYEFFNGRLFDGLLPPCMLTLDGRVRHCYGFFHPHRWEGEGGRRTHGISLNPTHLKGRPPRDVISTLVHEMAHLWQQEFGRPSRRGYHNREWAGRMITLGLMPSDTGRPGGRHVGDHMTHYVIEEGPFDRVFRAMPEQYLLPWVTGDPAPALTGGSTAADRAKVKYSCPACGVNVWGKPGLYPRIICGRCHVPLS